jgi:hypothetical protein
VKKRQKTEAWMGVDLTTMAAVDDNAGVEMR